MNFYFKVSYTPNPKDNSQEWYTEQEAPTLQEAEAEMKRRYPSFVPGPSRETYSFHHVMEVPKGAEFIPIR